MVSKRTKKLIMALEIYIVYIGEEIKDTFNDIESAEELYNSLPSGEGKRPSLRRSLVKETTIISDKR